MDNKTGKTFWDLVHESIVVKITLIGIVVVILAASIFFIANGYSVTTSGIIAPHETTDTSKSTQVVQNPKNANSNLSLHQLNGISRLVWVIVFLQIILVLLGILIFSTQIINRRKGKYVGNAEKKTETIEFIYKSFIAFTLFDREQSNELLANIQLLSRYTVDNGLYIDKHLMKLTNDITDYFKEVIVDYRTKSFAKEQELQNRFKSLIN